MDIFLLLEILLPKDVIWAFVDIADGKCMPKIGKYILCFMDGSKQGCLIPFNEFNEISCFILSNTAL